MSRDSRHRVSTNWSARCWRRSYRILSSVDRSHLYRRTAAEHHARHLLSRLKRNLDYDKLVLPEGALTLEQHFLDDDLCEDVVICRLSDNVRMTTISKRDVVFADICRCLHITLVHQLHSHLSRKNISPLAHTIIRVTTYEALHPT